MIKRVLSWFQPAVTAYEPTPPPSPPSPLSPSTDEFINRATLVGNAIVNDGPTQGKSLWALVDWEHFVENNIVFLTANGTSKDAAANACHDYFSIVGVSVNNWTYAKEKPTVEPAGCRWIRLDGGYALKVRI